MNTILGFPVPTMQMVSFLILFLLGMVLIRLDPSINIDIYSDALKNTTVRRSKPSLTAHLSDTFI